MNAQERKGGNELRGEGENEVAFRGGEGGGPFLDQKIGFWPRSASQEYCRYIPVLV